MSRVFISYRRQDSAPWSGKLFDSLAGRYGVDNVYLDIATIAPGMDFVAHVEAALSRSDVVLIVIGPQWLEASYRSDNRRRIDDPDDIVRREIQLALSINKPLVPVLVGGAEMPPTHALPADIARISQLMAHRLDDSRWNQDVAALVKVFEKQPRSFIDRLFGR
jgi:TIR domain